MGVRETEGLRESPGEREGEVLTEGERLRPTVRVALPPMPPPSPTVLVLGLREGETVVLEERLSVVLALKVGDWLPLPELLREELLEAHRLGLAEPLRLPLGQAEAEGVVLGHWLGVRDMEEDAVLQWVTVGERDCVGELVREARVLGEGVKVLLGLGAAEGEKLLLAEREGERDWEGVTLVLTLCEGLGVQEGEWVTLRVGEPVPVREPLGLPLKLRLRVPLTETVGEAERVPLTELLRDSAPLRETEGVPEPVAQARGERLPVEETLTVREGEGEGLGLRDVVPLPLGEEEGLGVREVVPLPQGEGEVLRVREDEPLPQGEGEKEALPVQLREAVAQTEAECVPEPDLVAVLHRLLLTVTLEEREGEAEPEALREVKTAVGLGVKVNTAMRVREIVGEKAEEADRVVEMVALVERDSVTLVERDCVALALKDTPPARGACANNVRTRRYSRCFEGARCWWHARRAAGDISAQGGRNGRREREKSREGGSKAWG